MTTTTRPVDNGVDTQALLDARTALTQAPQAAEFTWRATCTWAHGTHSRSTVEGFSARTTNVLGILGADPDVRNGFDAVDIAFDIDADASPEAIAAIVAQSQKRSAVFDILTNPTDVTVRVGSPWP